MSEILEKREVVETLDETSEKITGEVTRFNLFIRSIFLKDPSDFANLLELMSEERQRNCNKTIH